MRFDEVRPLSRCERCGRDQDHPTSNLCKECRGARFPYEMRASRSSGRRIWRIERNAWIECAAYTRYLVGDLRRFANISVEWTLCVVVTNHRRIGAVLGEPVGFVMRRGLKRVEAKGLLGR